jgi:glyoxylase-like metal-dependent hydrolase (beta-lactamase superfamily II)
MSEIIYSTPDLELHQLIVGPLDNNVYVLYSKDADEGILIDAANEHEKLLDICKKLKVTKVLETHGHWDHIQATVPLRNAGLSIYVTEQDASMLEAYDLKIADDQVTVIGDLELISILTPGHTPGSVCFYLKDTPLLFTGDTLFPGGPGNTKTPEGNFDQIIKSIDERLFSFGDDTIVLPGHGKSTTIGKERPHLDEWIERGW